MQVQKIDNSVYYSSESSAAKEKIGAEYSKHSNISQLNDKSLAKDTLSFKGGASNFTNRCWFLFRRLSNYMKNPSEMTNAAIAAIGTGAIAPFAIMCSPKPKKKGEDIDPKAAREKKKFQALRQPVSAALAFGFQVPTTIGIARGLNKLAYEKRLKLFDDEILGTLIPDKKYLTRQARKVLNGKADYLMETEWHDELIECTKDSEAITKGIKDQIRSEHGEFDLKITEEKLDRMANEKSRRLQYISERMADAKHENFVRAKVEELSGKEFNITDLDIVTEKYQDLARQRFKSDFAACRKEANLSWFDKVLEAMGFSNKNLKALSKREKELAQEKGRLLMQEDIAKGDLIDVFGNKNARLTNFIKNRITKSQKLYGNKIFWLSLVTNLFMVAISCVALNWIHPKFAKFVDGIRERKEAKRAEKNGGIEVRA